MIRVRTYQPTSGGVQTGDGVANSQPCTALLSVLCRPAWAPRAYIGWKVPLSGACPDAAHLTFFALAFPESSS